MERQLLISKGDAQSVITVKGSEVVKISPDTPDFLFAGMAWKIARHKLIAQGFHARDLGTRSSWHSQRSSESHIAQTPPAIAAANARIAAEEARRDAEHAARDSLALQIENQTAALRDLLNAHDGLAYGHDISVECVVMGWTGLPGRPETRGKHILRAMCSRCEVDIPFIIDYVSLRDNGKIARYTNNRRYDMEAWLAGCGIDNTEKGFADSVLARLEPWFEIEREVRGRHALSGQALRIDAVIIPREWKRWHQILLPLNRRPENPQASHYAMGIEFKKPGGDGYKTILGQCLDYAHTQFDELGNDGYMPIFSCPSFFGELYPGDAEEHHPDRGTMHLLAQKKAGQLVMTDRGWTLTFCKGRMFDVWNELDGPILPVRHGFFGRAA